MNTRLQSILAAALIAVPAALATVEIKDLQVANVGTTSITLVWSTSEVSKPGLDVYTDNGGTVAVTSMVGREFFPLAEGDVGMVNDADARGARRALEAVVASRSVVFVRVTGLVPGTTYFMRPRTFGAGGADNGSGLLPLRAVTTASFTGFVRDARMLRVQFQGFASEGMIALLHGPAGTLPVAAVVGDATAADSAVFPLAALIDSETGTNPLYDSPQSVVITLLGIGAPKGAYTGMASFTTAFGAVELEVITAGTPTASPIITGHPTDRMANPGASVSFSVSASGDPAPALQWQRLAAGGAGWNNVANDSTYSGVATDTLVVSGLSLAMNGDQFRAIASNGVVPNATSNAATLAVVEEDASPLITSQPQSITRGIDETASFTVVATGYPAPTYQWSKDGTPITGATSATYSIVNVAGADAGSYTVQVTNRAGSVASNAAVLTVNLTPPAPPPAPSPPPPAAADYDTIRFAWNAVARAVGYRVDVSTNAAFSSFVPGYQNFDAGNVTSLDIPGLRLGTYYMRVRAYNSGGTGANSATRSITIGGRLVNLATRGLTSVGTDVMIAGFYVQGTAPKQILIRAVGPTIGGPPYNVAGTVPDPRLRLYRMDPGGPVVEALVDDWDSNDAALVAATSRLGAFPLITGSKDAAVLVTLQPGRSYTAHVETATNETGVALVEIYESDTGGRLVNISTRTMVGTGDGILIPAFVMLPNGGPKRLLIRAVGQTLGEPPYNVPGVLVDPVMTLIPVTNPGTNPSFENDNWEDNANAAEIPGVSSTVGAFALNAGSKDAVLLMTLDTAVSGGYTIHVRGKNGGTGVVLVEVYEVP